MTAFRQAWPFDVRNLIVHRIIHTVWRVIWSLVRGITWAATAITIPSIIGIVLGVGLSVQQGEHGERLLVVVIILAFFAQFFLNSIVFVFQFFFRNSIYRKLTLTHGRREASQLFFSSIGILLILLWLVAVKNETNHWLVNILTKYQNEFFYYIVLCVPITRSARAFFDPPYLDPSGKTTTPDTRT